METLKAKIRTQETAVILDMIMQIGGGQVAVEQRMVRAALIDIFIERAGVEAGDALMDELGL